MHPRHVAATVIALSMVTMGARASGPYTVGSGNVANIEPAVPHPDVTPCAVPLFTGATFGANAMPFSYAPPAGCGTSWARVVLRTTIGLDAGVQFDRTGSITLGGVTLWFGTTAEPRRALAPLWTVETDVTRDTALLRHAGAGRVLIANYQSSQYPSTITASSTLLFYPASRRDPAPDVPDLVIPVASDTSGDVANLQTPADMLSASLSLPTNVIGAELDLTLQGQQGDEFWYTCVPDALAAALSSCGGGAFRAGEVTLDGHPAGEAPAYPLIFTGGIDPFLWQPIPGVETLNIKPFAVPLTPFAALLSSGGIHTLSVSVAGANHYFSTFGTLYVTLDKHASRVSGGLVRDTLAGAPAPRVTVSTGTASDGATTAIATKAADDFTIEGVVRTSSGTIDTTVHQTSQFSNVQDFLIGSAVYNQVIRQSTLTRTVVTSAGPFGRRQSVDLEDYPLTASLDEAIAGDGSAALTSTISQALRSSLLRTLDGVPVGYRALRWAASPTDTLAISAAGSLTGNSAASSRSRYALVDTASGCDLVTLASAGNALTAAAASGSCLAALRALDGD